VPVIDKSKYLVPIDLTVGQLTTVGQFVYVIRKRMKMPPEEVLFLFVGNNQIPKLSDLMSTVYDLHKDAEDGFLYVKYAGENLFG